MQYKIIVDKQSRTNPSSEKREYIIDIEELRRKGDIADSLVITKDEDYIMRRLSLSEYHVLKVLDEPIKQPLQDINIELFEGDNYIYLVDMVGNKFYAEYLIKNEFNDVFITKSEARSEINQSAKQIELAVSETLTNYATTEETQAIIQALADQINLELTKKVNGETITGAYLLLTINEDTSAAKLSADKIQLTANDVLNLLAGNTINISGKNIKISSTNLNITEDGTLIIGGSEANPKFIVTDNNNTIKVVPDKILLERSNAICGWIAVTSSGSCAITMFNGGDIIISKGSNMTEISQDGIYTPQLTQTSVKSKKKNIKTLKIDALELIKNADICLYNIRGEKAKTKKHIGLVIGEGYNCPNEVISEDGQGVEQYSMTSLAWKAIQELIEKNKELQQRLERLEAK